MTTQEVLMAAYEAIVTSDGASLAALADMLEESGMPSHGAALRRHAREVPEEQVYVFSTPLWEASYTVTVRSYYRVRVALRRILHNLVWKAHYSRKSTASALHGDIIVERTVTGPAQEITEHL